MRIDEIRKPPKENWFETLRSSLDSEGLLDYWPADKNISYGQTVNHIAEIDGRHHYITIYRSDSGRYERPVHYDSGSIAANDKREQQKYKQWAKDARK